MEYNKNCKRGLLLWVDCKLGLRSLLITSLELKMSDKDMAGRQKGEPFSINGQSKAVGACNFQGINHDRSLG